MESLDFIVSLVSNVSFPIAACVIIWINSRKQQEAYREDIEKMRATVDRNTEAMTAQKELLCVIKDRIS